MAGDPGPTAGRPRWWEWPTILSLDAPLVAVIWQQELAAAAGVRLHAVHAFVLGASVWLSYVADRWIGGWRLDPGRVRTHRHRFYQRWSWPIAGLGVAVVTADFAAACAGLSRREFVAGLLLLGPVAAYLLSHQLLHAHHRRRPPKEICVAGLLGAGAGLFVAAAPAADLRALAAPLELLVLLCLANCALIGVWESRVDRDHGETSLAVQFRRGTAFSRALPWILAAASAALVPAVAPPARPAAACALASSLLLALVDRLEARLGRQPARVLADVALLTPALPLALALFRA
jgi:hypothetical protein